MFVCAVDNRYRWSITGQPPRSMEMASMHLGNEFSYGFKMHGCARRQVVQLLRPSASELQYKVQKLVDNWFRTLHHATAILTCRVLYLKETIDHSFPLFTKRQTQNVKIILPQKDIQQNIHFEPFDSRKAANSYTRSFEHAAVKLQSFVPARLLPYITMWHMHVSIDRTRLTPVILSI